MNAIKPLFTVAVFSFLFLYTVMSLGSCIDHLEECSHSRADALHSVVVD